MNEIFSTSHAFYQARKLFKKNVQFLSSAIAATTVIVIILQVLMGVFERNAILSIIMTVVSTIVMLAITLGWTNVILKTIRGNSKKWEDFKTPYITWWRVFLGQIITAIPTVALIALAAVITFVLVNVNPILVFIAIPIITAFVGLVAYINIRLMFLNALAIDNSEIGPVTLLKKSAKITKGRTLDLLGFSVAMLFINLAGLAAFGVGLFITIPLTSIAKVLVYEKIKGKNTHSAGIIE